MDTQPKKGFEINQRGPTGLLICKSESGTLIFKLSYANSIKLMYGSITRNFYINTFSNR